MTREEFDKLVEESVAEIPADLRQRMDNVVIMVQDYPDGELLKKYGKLGLFGIFIGVSLTRQSWEGGYHPHHIILFQKTIEKYCHNDAEVKQQIRTTLFHEVGHFFGFNEEEIRRLQGLPQVPKE